MPLFPDAEPVSIIYLGEPSPIADHLDAWCGSHDQFIRAAGLASAEADFEDQIELAVIGADLAHPASVGWVRSRPYLGPLGMVVPDPDDVDALLPVDWYLAADDTREAVHRALESVLFSARRFEYELDLLELLAEQYAIERRLTRYELEHDTAYQLISERAEKRLDRLGVTITPIGSKYRPDTCGACDLPWDVRVGKTVGFVQISSYSWKCVRCNEVTPNVNPFDRSVARR